MRFLFTFHQLVDAWRKFAYSGSKVILLRCNMNSRLEENIFIQKEIPIRKLESCASSFFE